MAQRILYVQPYNWPGGPHESLKALIRNLNRSEFEPVVLLPCVSAAAEEYRSLGAEIWYDRAVSIVPRSYSPFKHRTFVRSIIQGSARLAERIRSSRIVLVHSNAESCWLAGFAARAARVPTISHIRGMRAVSPRWVGRLTTSYLNRFNALLVATSVAVERAYVKCGARPELITVIHNGIDTSRFDPQRARPTLRHELRLPEDVPIVGMIATLNPRKGHHDFVEACAIVAGELRAAHFVIVGDTADSTNGSGYYNQVRKLVASRGLSERLHFTGPRTDIPDVLRSLDVIAQPSLTEAGPRVPIEAMAMGTPIVVTDVGGNSEEVEHGKTGLVVPVNNPQAVATAILRLLTDRRLAIELGTAGRERVLTHFTQEQHTERVQNLYRRVLHCPAMHKTEVAVEITPWASLSDE